MDSQSESTTTTTTAPPTTDLEHIELQAFPLALPATAEPPTGNTDPGDAEEDELDASFPLGVKLTTYRLLNLVVILAFGLAKFISSLEGQSIAPAGLEWGAGSIFAALSYWIGCYEPVQPPRWEWLLHVDLAPVIGFSLKCFLGGVLHAFVLFWEMLLFYLFIGVPLLVLSRFTLSPASFVKQRALYVLFTLILVALLIAILPENWRVWKRMSVWNPVGRLIRRYGLNYAMRRRYRLFRLGGFLLGLLSGTFVIDLSLSIPSLLILQNMSRPPTEGRAT